MSQIEYENEAKDAIDAAFDGLDDEGWEYFIEEIMGHLDDKREERGR